MKKLLKGLGIIVLALVVIVIGYFIFMTVTDYKPPKTLTLETTKGPDMKAESLKTGTPFTVTTFNIGYCGLDKGQDFFLDGGTMSRSSSKEQTMKNLDSITKFLMELDSTFVVLQEVDIKSSRSFKVDQVKHMKESLTVYESTFAVNYKVPWVPVPLTHPMGSAYGGLLTFSKHSAEKSTRYQFPGQEAWPRQLAELDRCFIESRIPVEGGKELILINAHLSAYDKGGQIRKQQLGFLKEYISNEYKNGNYVIVGGDWNHVIPGTDPKLFTYEEVWPEWCVEMPSDFLPEGFMWVADKMVPTVRQNSTAYKEGYNFVAVIDGMLISPNVELVKVQGHDLKFENSDHNPVTGTYILK
ncbi:MAG: endonuclease/exonuclease/phosphatase family protein [Bacillota bacterium]